MRTCPPRKTVNNDSTLVVRGIIGLQRSNDTFSLARHIFTSIVERKPFDLSTYDKRRVHEVFQVLEGFGLIKKDGVTYVVRDSWKDAVHFNASTVVTRMSKVWHDLFLEKPVVEKKEVLEAMQRVYFADKDNDRKKAGPDAVNRYFSSVRLTLRACGIIHILGKGNSRKEFAYAVNEE